MSEFADQRLQCLEGDRCSMENRVCFLDVGHGLGHRKADGALDSIKAEANNHVLQGLEVSIPLHQLLVGDGFFSTIMISDQGGGK